MCICIRRPKSVCLNTPKRRFTSLSGSYTEDATDGLEESCFSSSFILSFSEMRTPQHGERGWGVGGCVPRRRLSKKVLVLSSEIERTPGNTFHNPWRHSEFDPNGRLNQRPICHKRECAKHTFWYAKRTSWGTSDELECSDALSLDACRSKCFSTPFKRPLDALRRFQTQYLKLPARFASARIYIYIYIYIYKQKQKQKKLKTKTTQTIQTNT